MVAVAITRDEHTPAELRREASRCGEGAAARRMLALALVKEGQTGADAARLCGMDRQTLRDWVHRYNAAGLAGLLDKQGRPGPKPRLSAEQEAEVAGLVREGPDPARDGVVRWRRMALARVIENRFSISLAERHRGQPTPAAWLCPRLGPSRHPKGGAAAQASFGPGSATL